MVWNMKTSGIVIALYGCEEEDGKSVSVVRGEM